MKTNSPTRQSHRKASRRGPNIRDEPRGPGSHSIQHSMQSNSSQHPQAVERPALVSGDLLGVPYLVDNLREWAAEFRANQHPVTLTLFRAIHTLEKMDAAMAKDDREIVRLDAEIARYRAAISDYCEAQDDPDVAGDSKFLDRLRATLEPREKQPTPVWKKYGHPSEVSSPNDKAQPRPESGH